MIVNIIIFKNSKNDNKKQKQKQTKTTINELNSQYIMYWQGLISDCLALW